MNLPRVPMGRVPSLPTEAMGAIDAAALTAYAIDTTQLMEIAGFQVARAAVAVLGRVQGKRVVVAAGGGNNGGDALAAARFLFQRGAVVQVWMRANQRLSPLAAHHRQTVQRLGIAVQDASDTPLPAGDLVLDGLLGTGIQLALRSDVAAMIHAINQAGIPVLAIDLPSGLDANSGAGRETCIQADWTVTLGLPKPALPASPATGRLLVADVGLPIPLFGTLADAVRHLYAEGDLVEVLPGS
ncbi:MAG TPA: NAD(P)H-hydrate epimerase [Candidatus Dormibacteraeota bacterium]|nr:NAD(P)H-hydrate epimerase [Candidatus Dormibacteraeota bacterium]